MFPTRSLTRAESASTLSLPEQARAAASRARNPSLHRRRCGAKCSLLLRTPAGPHTLGSIAFYTPAMSKVTRRRSTRIVALATVSSSSAASTTTSASVITWSAASASSSSSSSAPHAIQIVNTGGTLPGLESDQIALQLLRQKQRRLTSSTESMLQALPGGISAPPHLRRALDA